MRQNISTYLDTLPYAVRRALFSLKLDLKIEGFKAIVVTDDFNMDDYVKKDTVMKISAALGSEVRLAAYMVIVAPDLATAVTMPKKDA